MFDWLKRARGVAPLRGRVHRVAIVRGGELSVTLRFGVDEPDARVAFNQGVMVEVLPIAPETPAGELTTKGKQ